MLGLLLAQSSRARLGVSPRTTIHLTLLCITAWAPFSEGGSRFHTNPPFKSVE